MWHEEEERAVRAAVLASGLRVRLAASEEDVLDAQRLRYEVFHDEMGATLCSGESGFDQDRFDPFCDHLIVRDEREGKVVGTYRILSPEQARRAGGWYAEGEFDLANLHPLSAGLAEVGRSCVHPRYRSGPAILMLWSGLVRYLNERGFAYVMGCASMDLLDGGRAAAGVYERLKKRHLSPESLRTPPLQPLPMDGLPPDLEAGMPPLIKGYLRLGAVICGPPAWDRAFGTADFLTLLRMSDMNPRYAKRLARS